MNSLNNNSEISVDLPCLCALIRKAGRVVTKEYDGFLNPIGIKITQYSLLVNIRKDPNLTVSELSEHMRMDQTTITRNLKVLEKSNYLFMVPDHTDKRVRQIHVTKSGKEIIAQTRSSWELAQQNLTQALGSDKTKIIIESLQQLINR